MFRIEHRGEVVVVTPERGITSVNAEVVKAELRRLVSDGHLRLVLDLSGETYLDSAALGALLTVLKAARAAGGDLRLAGLTGYPLEILRLTRLERVFTVHHSLDEAVESLSS